MAFNTLYATAQQTFTFTFNGAGIGYMDSSTTLNALGPRIQQTSPPDTIKSIAVLAIKHGAAGIKHP